MQRDVRLSREGTEEEEVDGDRRGEVGEHYEREGSGKTRGRGSLTFRSLIG